jgi:hypothetical protein
MTVRRRLGVAAFEQTLPRCARRCATVTARRLPPARVRPAAHFEQRTDVVGPRAAVGREKGMLPPVRRFGDTSQRARVDTDAPIRPGPRPPWVLLPAVPRGAPRHRCLAPRPTRSQPRVSRARARVRPCRQRLRCSVGAYQPPLPPVPAAIRQRDRAAVEVLGGRGPGGGWWLAPNAWGRCRTHIRFDHRNPQLSGKFAERQLRPAGSGVRRISTTSAKAPVCRVA